TVPFCTPLLSSDCVFEPARFAMKVLRNVSRDPEPAARIPAVPFWLTAVLVPPTWFSRQTELLAGSPKRPSTCGSFRWILASLLPVACASRLTAILKICAPKTSCWLNGSRGGRKSPGGRSAKPVSQLSRRLVVSLLATEPTVVSAPGAPAPLV